jgi:hypothetical protein
MLLICTCDEVDWVPELADESFRLHCMGWCIRTGRHLGTDGFSKWAAEMRPFSQYRMR